MDNLFETIAAIANPSNYPLVFFDKLWVRIKTENGWVNQIQEGDRVFIHEGKLCNCMDKPTHVITSLRGRMNGFQGEITVMDLSSRELSIVKL